MIELFLDIIKHRDGGKGSGNFGHRGRPGKRGGSGKGAPKILDASQLDKVWEEYNKRVSKLKENDHMGFRYYMSKSDDKVKKKFLDLLQSTLQTGVGLFKDDAAVEEAEKQFEQAVNSGDMRLANKLKTILRDNMVAEALHDIASEMYGDDIAEAKKEADTKEETDTKEEADVTQDSKDINGFDISNNSDVFDSDGKSDIVFTTLALGNRALPFIENSDIQHRFDNVLLLNTSEFINFCNSKNSKIDEYKHGNYQNELLDAQSDMRFYLQYPTLIDEDTKNKIFSLAYNNYDLSNIVDKGLDIDPPAPLLYDAFEDSGDLFEKMGYTAGAGWIAELRDKKGDDFVDGSSSLDEESRTKIADSLLEILAPYANTSREFTSKDQHDYIKALTIQFLNLDRSKLKKEDVDSIHLADGVAFDKLECLEDFGYILASVCNFYRLDCSSLSEMRDVVYRTFKLPTKSEFVYQASPLQMTLCKAADSFLPKGDLEFCKVSGFSTFLKDTKIDTAMDYLNLFFQNNSNVDAATTLKDYLDECVDVINDRRRITTDVVDRMGVDNLNDLVHIKAAFDYLADNNEFDGLEGADIVDKLRETLKKMQHHELDISNVNKGWINIPTDPWWHVETVEDGWASAIEIYAQSKGLTAQEIYTELQKSGVSRLNGFDSDIVADVLNGEFKDSRPLSFENKVAAAVFTAFGTSVEEVRKSTYKELLEALHDGYDSRPEFKHFKVLDIDKAPSINMSLFEKNILGNASRVLEVPLNELCREFQKNNLSTLYKGNWKQFFKDKEEPCKKLADSMQQLIDNGEDPKKILESVSIDTFQSTGMLLAACSLLTAYEKAKEDNSSVKVQDVFKDLMPKLQNGECSLLSTTALKDVKVFDEFATDSLNVNGKLIKANTEQLDSFADELSNNVYTSKKNDFTNLYVGAGGTFPSKIGHIKLTGKERSELASYDIKPDKNKMRHLQEAAKETVAVCKRLCNENRLDFDTIESIMREDIIKNRANGTSQLYSKLTTYANMLRLQNQNLSAMTEDELFEKLNVPPVRIESQRGKDLSTLPDAIKSNRIASRYQAIKNKPDIESSILNTTTIKDAKLDKSFDSKRALNLLNSIFPTLELPSDFYKELVMGSKVETRQKGISDIGSTESELFEKRYATNSSLAKLRQTSSETGSAEPVSEYIQSGASKVSSLTYDDLRSLIRLITTSGYHYTSALQEDTQGMGSFMRTVAAASPVYEGEFLRCERATDMYRNYNDIKIGDTVTFNAQHFTYDPVNFGKAAAHMFGEIGFRVKGKMPFLNMMPYVKRGKMTEWEGLVAGCFKVTKITENTKEYNANFEKLIDLEFDWEKWNSYIHANAKMFANQIGLYNRNMQMKAKDFLNKLIRKLYLRGRYNAKYR